MLILASASPRRHELLVVLGLPFTIETADIDESALPDEAPEPHARRLAETKARTISNRSGEAVVLAADTIVVQHGQILGKPGDATDARRMLQSLRDAPHRVITAVAVSQPQGRVMSISHTSRVVMRPYTNAEIDAYIASGDPMDKAGAYAIQNSDFMPVAHFDGCFASIMGLPLGVVAELLQRAGLEPEPDWAEKCDALTGSCCQLLPVIASRF